MIDHMPGYSPHRIAGVPASRHQGCTGAGLGEHGGDLLPQRLEGVRVVRLEGWVAQADFAGIRPLGFDYMALELVAVTPALTRAFALLAG
jgi:hypothetical protein